MDTRMLCRSAAMFAVAWACLWSCFAVPAARAQEPSANAVAMAKELIVVKGGTAMFDPVVPGVIESAKNSYVPTNPNLMRELNEVAAVLHKELDEPKKAELLNEVARIYAQRFTEQELKDILAFYKTPLGLKLLKEEPAALQASLTRAQDWANAFSDVAMSRIRAEMQKKGHPL